LQERPIDDMLGYGSHHVPKGTWSDDTSMALCSLESIAEKGTIDLDDTMVKFAWWIEKGYMTPHGEVFDVGRTCLRAITEYRRGKDTEHCGCNTAADNGNGSLMRMIPISLYNYFRHLSTDESIINIHKASAITHAHKRSCIACGIYDFVMQELLVNPCKESIFSALKKAERYYANETEIRHYQRIFEDDFAKTGVNEIKSSGYVVDTLEAVIWCLLTTDNYRECVLKAANLGEDTDTVAAIAGGLAGVLYGYDAISQEWLSVLAKREEIEIMCEKFYSSVTE